MQWIREQVNNKNVQKNKMQLLYMQDASQHEQKKFAKKKIHYFQLNCTPSLLKT